VHYFCINHRVGSDIWCTDTESVITVCGLMTGALLLNQSTLFQSDVWCTITESIITVCSDD